MQDTILILTNSIGGLFNFRQEVLQALVNENFHVVIAAPYNKKIQVFLDMGCEFVLTNFKIKGTNPWHDIQLTLKYRKLIMQYHPFAVLTYTIKPNVYGGMACRWCRIPQLANITGLGTAVEEGGWMQKLTIWLYRIGLKKTHTIFFQNKANCLLFLDKGIIKGSYELIPGSGVNLHHHAFQKMPDDNTVRFLFLGRIFRQKGIDEFLGAAEIIKKKYPFTEFHIVGSCYNQYATKINYYKERGIIVYHGQQLDVRPFYEMVHCTVCPSYYPEGMSNVLLESCAAGRPIITTNRPGCGEAVDDGINGFLVREKDPTDLACQIEKFIRLSMEQKILMGINAREKVEREFDRNIVVSAYLKAIARIRNERQ